MGKIADVVDHHRMMGFPGVIHREAGPGVVTCQFGNFRDFLLFGLLRIAREKPDQAIAFLQRIGSQLVLDQRLAEAVMRIVGQPAIPVERPAMIGTAQLTLIYSSMGELQMAMWTTVLDRRQYAVFTPKNSNRKIPEADFPDLTLADPGRPTRLCRAFNFSDLVHD